MAAYKIKMTHTERTLESLAHMQYDLFCRRNRIVRQLISVAAMVFGVINFSAWWGILLIAYGGYLITSTYSSSNRTAHKLAEQIEASCLGYPRSEYVFEDKAMYIFSPSDKKEVNEPLFYSNIKSIGEDSSYFYIFRNEFGGYMIPKEALGDKLTAFRDFIEKKSGQAVINPRSPLKRLLASLRRRENEPYHL